MTLTQHTDNIVCPYCKYVFKDSFEIQPDDLYLGVLTCDECYKPFYASREVEVEYTTAPVKFGTCLGCGDEDVFIEDFHSSIGYYKDLCQTCGKERKKIIIEEYFDDVTEVIQRRKNIDE